MVRKFGECCCSLAGCFSESSKDRGSLPGEDVNPARLLFGFNMINFLCSSFGELVSPFGAQILMILLSVAGGFCSKPTWSRLSANTPLLEGMDASAFWLRFNMIEGVCACVAPLSSGKAARAGFKGGCSCVFSA